MATYTFTAASVLAGTAQGGVHVAGEEITAGLLCYLDTSDASKAKIANNSTQAKAAVHGIALNHAYTGQPVSILTTGEVTVQASVFTTEGQVLSLSDSVNAGKLEDVEDLAAAEYATILGWVTDDDKFMLNIDATGLAHSAP